MVDKLYSCRSS